ncbi:MAG: hypothetical protein MHM6MM_004954 [Cercozoa sp. M6MM]
MSYFRPVTARAGDTARVLSTDEAYVHLYRHILRLHRHMPTQFRRLGDQMAKHEFRENWKRMNEEQSRQFFAAWNAYLTQTAEQIEALAEAQKGGRAAFGDSDRFRRSGGEDVPLGQAIQLDVAEDFSAEQRQQLGKMHAEISQQHEQEKAPPSDPFGLKLGPK